MLAAMLGAVYFLTHQVAVTSRVLLGIPEDLQGPDVSMWVAVVLIQSIPYAAALIVSLISAASLPARWLGRLPGTSFQSLH
jgi:hypothetical protein